jgi:hypothetical protein
MKVSNRFENYLIEALSQSMPTHVMEKLCARLIPDYDLYRRTGFPATIPIPNIDAARQIVRDIKQLNSLPQFVAVLIDVNRNGLMGRSIQIRSLDRILKELEALGLLFREEYGIFMEDHRRNRTSNWGVLREGEIYEFSFLKLDIVGNSELVRRHDKATVDRAYEDLKKIAARIVAKREGRIWRWEGDGGLAAFYFGHKNIQATLSGAEILLELFMYNMLECALERPLSIRMAVHTGPCRFFNSLENLQSDTLRRLETIESRHTLADSLTLSPGVYTDLGTKLGSFFTPFKETAYKSLYRYKLDWE